MKIWGCFHLWESNLAMIYQSNHGQKIMKIIQPSETHGWSDSKMDLLWDGCFEYTVSR